MKIQILVITISFCIVLSGCTQVTVKPAEDDKPASYYLPQPYIFITPKEDGTLDVRTESISNHSEGYSVSAKSFLASHKLLLKQNHGLLSEVALTRDSSAVAAESVKTAGAIKKAGIEARVARETKKLEKLEEREDSRLAAINKIKEALQQAEIELGQAKAAYKVSKSEDNKITLRKAEAKVKVLQKQLRNITNGGSFSYKFDDKGSFSIAKNNVKRPGPLILLVDEREMELNDGKKEWVFQLVPINFGEDGTQKIFDGYHKPPKPDSAGEANKDPKQIEFKKSNLGEVSWGDKVEISTKNEFIDTLTITKMVGSSGDDIGSNFKPTITRLNSKTFEFTIIPHTPADQYVLTISGSIRSDSPFINGDLKIKIRQ